MGIGSIEDPYVETHFIAGFLTNVHWKNKKPGPSPLRTVFGLIAEPGTLGNVFHGEWDAVESGTETGAATVQFPPGSLVGETFLTMSLLSFSGSNIYGTNPVKFISISPGANWDFTLTVKHGAPTGPFAGPVSLTFHIVVVNIADQTPGETVLSITAAAEPGETVTVSETASGTAPN